MLPCVSSLRELEVYDGAGTVTTVLFATSNGKNHPTFTHGLLSAKSLC